jgi:4-amino-4-deoxy-L-arabinose transferase-like glycosyltransferase
VILQHSKMESFRRTPVWKSGSTWLIIVILTLAAALPRFYDLDSLGFYGDEETTAFPARAVAEGRGAKMPSGMPYRRALPLTWLNALSAKSFGVNRELSYRVPAAIFGTLTIPLLFLLARPLVGGPVALVAAVLLALSEWHIATSREARMYAPFLFFYVAAAFATWQWAITGANWKLLVAALLFAVSLSLHALGVMGVMFAVIPIAFAGWARVTPMRLLAAAAISGICAHAYAKYFVGAAYRAWIPAQDALSSTSAAISRSPWVPEPLASLPFWAIVFVLTGAGMGLWAAARAEPEDSLPGRQLRLVGRHACAALAGSLACIGQLYGASVAALIFLYLHPEDRSALARKIWLQLGIVVLIAIVWSAVTVAELGLVPGLKVLVGFPFPYPAFLAEMFPVVFLLFIGAAIYLALRAHQAREYPLRASILAVILPVTVVGIVSRWGGVRYLFETYPFLLLVAAAAILALLNGISRFFGRWNTNWSLMFALIIVASGLLGGHGIPQALMIATLEHGDPVDRRIYAYPFYPDHKAAGEFVRRNLAPGDVVIAEDPLQQQWYSGQADYWLRNPADAQSFTYKASDGHIRDIYVNSRLLENQFDLYSVIDEATGRVWVITSGETYPRRNYFLTLKQRRWLKSLEDSQLPVFIGRDGASKVFCIGCAGPEAGVK